jgi:hypothetical protein
MQSSPPTTLQEPRTSQPLQLQQTSRWLAPAVAVLLAAFYFATSIYIASHRLFWFDEFFTIRIAQLPSWTMIWTALSHAADSLPPFYYMLVGAFMALFGHSELAARLPSALAMIAGLLLTFDCARRLTDGLHGLIALSVLTCSFLPYYGYEARSYAMYFMFAALGFWLWTRMASSLRAAVYFGAALLLGVTMHYYAVMCLAPYALWEVLRWKPGRRFSAKLIAGAVGVAVPAALLSPLILSFSRKFSSGYWNRPSLAELRAIFPQLFPDALLLLALIVVWIVLSSFDQKDDFVQPMEEREAIGWLFLTIPLIGFVLAELGTNAFFSRYFICVLPGVAVAFACLLWRNFRKNWRVAVGIFLLVAGWGMWKQIAVVQHPETVEATGIREFLSLEPALRGEGKRYIVFSPPLIFSEAQYYSSHPDDCILLLPPDFQPQPVPPSGMPAAPDPYLHQRLLLNLSQFYPMQFWQLYNLKAYAPEVALIEPSLDVLEALQRSGVQVQVRSAAPLRVVYLR